MQCDLSGWKKTSSEIDPQINMKISKTFFAVLKFIQENAWDGACHASTAILYVLLREQNVKAELYIGEVSRTPIVFDHSWLEIENKIYDAAISKTLVEGINFPPVMANIDLSTGSKTNLSYGINSGQGYDPIAKQIKQLPLGVYMDNFPGHPKGLWGLAKEIGKTIGVNINLGGVKSRHFYTAWKEKT